MEKQTRAQIQVLISIFIAAFLFVSNAKAGEPGYVSLGKFKNDKGEMIEAGYKPTPKAKLVTYRPSKMLSQGAALRNQIRAQCTKSGSAVVNFALKQYPVESTTFNIAVGLAAGEQLKEDPAYARHFIEQSYLDPMGHVSFMGFMLGNRAAATLFSMTGLSYDPCRILKRNPLSPVEAFEQRQFQKYMHFVQGPVGLAAGMLLSDMGHQILTDPNIRLCARFQIGAVKGKSAREKAVHACDEAYTSWVLEGGEKIKELIPDMINMGAVVTAMSLGNIAGSKLVKPTASMAGTLAKKGAMKVVDEATLRFSVVQNARYWIWEGLDMTVSIGSKIPTPATRFGAFVRFAATNVASIYVFNWLNEKFSPIFKKPISVFMQGADIESTLKSLDEEIARTRSNGWVYTVKKKPDYCDPKALESIMTAQAAAGGVPFIPQECYKTSEKPEELIARLGKQEKKWRDFIMTDTMVAANNWTDYVLKFANIYTDARKFYFDILKRVWTIRNRPNEPDELKQFLPLGGMDVNLSEWPTRKACDLPEENRLLLTLAVEEINKQIVDSQKPTIKVPTWSWKPQWNWKKGNLLPRVSVIEYKNDGRLNNPLSVDRLVTVKDLVDLKEGFKALVCSYKLENIARDLKKSEKVATAQEIERLRWKRYFNSLRLLYLNLNAYPHFDRIAKESDPNDEAYEELSTTNIYMRVNIILASQKYGGPEPMNPGVGYVKSRRYDPTDIVQSMKNEHPMMVGSIDTAHMPEYLLASMVCGPEASKSIAKKAHWSVEFRPPRVIPYLGTSICGMEYDPKTKLGATKRFIIGRPDFHFVGAEPAHYDAHMSEWMIKGKKYTGLLEILKAHASPSIVGGANESNIVQWWSKYVGSQAEPLFKSFRAEFVREVLNKKFFTAIQNTSRSSDRHWIVANSKGMAKGIDAAMKEQLNEHLALIDPIIRAKKLGPEDEAKYQAIYTAIQTHLKIGLMMLAPPSKFLKPAIGEYVKAPDVDFDPNKWAEGEWSLWKAHPKDEIAAAIPKITGPMDEVSVNAFKLNQIDLRHAILNLQEFAKAKAQEQGAQAATTLNPIIDAIVNNLGTMVTDIDSYHGFLVSVRLEVAD
jgi:hypothetical protein